MSTAVQKSFGRRRNLVLLSIAMVWVFGGCSNTNGDINRVVNLYSDKSYINPNWDKNQLSPEWYYRLTVVDTPTNTQSASIGDGHWLHPESIRWEITEKFLIGWRAHAAVPGAEGELEKGVSDYRGAPVVVFRIDSHFDIVREYDPVTAEKSNVISENSVDRLWHKRRFMRIDWSKNLASEMKRQDAYPWVWGSENVERDNAYAVQQNDPANPKRLRFEDSYFEVTTRQGVKIDIMSYMGGYGEAYRFDAAAPVVDIRLSFMKKANDDYEPLHYPDFVTLVDDTGKEIRDRQQFAKRMPIWEKFGFYRAAFSGQQNWDPRRGSVESNKNYNITRFNIWKQTYQENVDKEGKKIRALIPIEEREPKPIVYYANVLHPESLMNASRKVEAEWNHVFKELVFFAKKGKYKSIDDVPDMWILMENSCNVKNVESTFATVSSDIREQVLDASKKDLSDIKRRLTEANDRTNNASFTARQDQESQAKSDLENICSALEFFTQGSEKPFKYERPGDLRYNMLNLVTKRAPTAWSGLGPMLADSLTGEIIQATANVNLWYIDRRAAQASEQIDIMLGNVQLEDLIFGKDVQKYMASKMAQIRAESAAVPSPQALKKMDRHFDSLERSDALLKPISPLAIEQRLSLVAKTSMEKKLFKLDGDETTDEVLLLQNSAGLGSGGALDFSEEMLEQLSPARGHDFAHQLLNRRNEIAKLSYTFADPPEFLDQLIVGVALQYKDLNKRERFEKIREAVYTAVMLHEVGHNMGLTHNMAASSDALNYGKHFWELETLPPKIENALILVSDDSVRKTLTDCVSNAKLIEDKASESGVDYTLTTQDCLRQQEVMYSSIMDYHASWNADLGGLGPYDKAAIKFGYAQLAETFPQGALNVDTGAQSLNRWLFLNDWRKIPTELVKGQEKIYERDHIKYSWGRTSTNFKAPTNEVPYRFCIDSSGSYGPTCKAFDFGPDMRTQAQWSKTNYWQHYFLTHFARDRVWSYDWDFQNVVATDLGVMEDFNNIMRWYYFLRATDKDFKGSDAEKDYLAAVISGLNHYGQVLGHPAAGEHISAPVHFVESVVKSSANTDRLTASNIMLPWNDVDQCVRLNVAQTKDGLPIAPLPGHFLSNVALGDGRPFYMGLNHDYEDWHVTYVGSFYSKLYAGFFLAYPGAWFPRTDQLVDPRFYSINWYRLFPKEVGKLFYDLMAQNWTELGPIVDEKGNVHQRNLVDPVTLETPNYSGLGRLLPSMSSFMPYRAMFYSASLLSGHKGSELDMIKMMRVALKGSEDDLSTLDGMSSDDVATFVHPTHGFVYRALNAGDYPIAYELVGRLNTLKDKYVRLDKCANDASARANDTYCRCVRTSISRPQGGASCCYPGNPACSSMELQNVGDDSCSMRDLQQRRDRSREEMEDLVSFLDDMRWFVKLYGNLP